MISKPELRATMRALRKSLAEASPDAAICAASFIDDLPAGRMVAVYRAVGTELDTEPLARALERAGRSLCLPVAMARDAALIFRRWTPGDPLEMDVAGCPAPLSLAETVTPHLIIPPLLAFDAEGGRLGQGGGYYDRTFAALPEAIRIGLGYAGQMVSRSPIYDHDVRLHGTLTERGYRTYPFDISRSAP